MPQFDLGALVSYAFTAFFAAIFLYICWIAAREWAFWYWLVLYGVETEGEVIATHGTGGAKGGSLHNVIYKFTVQYAEHGATYSRQHRIRACLQTITR
jgi:hypothetical protein